MDKKTLENILKSACNGGKVVVEYRDNEGYRVKGVAFDLVIQESATGNEFIYVDSFSNRVTLDKIISTKII